MGIFAVFVGFSERKKKFRTRVMARFRTPHLSHREFVLGKRKRGKEENTLQKSS
jgi:hypothetical protein